MTVVRALTTTPVKGLRVTTREELEIGPDGVADDRRFFLVDERGRLVNGKRLGALTAVTPTYDHAQRALALAFPDGSVVAGTVELGERLDVRFFSRPAHARAVRGPWSEALSAHAGEALRLVERDDRLGVDRGRDGAVSLVSRASLAALARAAGVDGVDARRFRMLVEVDGVAEHAEDAWIGGRVRIGSVLVRVNGNVGRCIITSRHPETGEVDLPTLDILRDYRAGARTSEPLPFGVYGEVLEPGRVRVGDTVVS